MTHGTSCDREYDAEENEANEIDKMNETNDRNIAEGMTEANVTTLQKIQCAIAQTIFITVERAKCSTEQVVSGELGRTKKPIMI